MQLQRHNSFPTAAGSASHCIQSTDYSSAHDPRYIVLKLAMLSELGPKIAQRYVPHTAEGEEMRVLIETWRHLQMESTYDVEESPGVPGSPALRRASAVTMIVYPDVDLVGLPSPSPVPSSGCALFRSSAHNFPVDFEPDELDITLVSPDELEDDSFQESDEYKSEWTNFAGDTEEGYGDTEEDYGDTDADSGNTEEDYGNTEEDCGPSLDELWEDRDQALYEMNRGTDMDVVVDHGSPGSMTSDEQGSSSYSYLNTPLDGPSSLPGPGVMTSAIAYASGQGADDDIFGETLTLEDAFALGKGSLS